MNSFTHMGTYFFPYQVFRFFFPFLLTKVCEKKLMNTILKVLDFYSTNVNRFKNRIFFFFFNKRLFSTLVFCCNENQYRLAFLLHVIHLQFAEVLAPLRRTSTLSMPTLFKISWYRLKYATFINQKLHVKYIRRWNIFSNLHLNYIICCKLF